MSSPPFTVKAIFEYSSDHDDDLSFPIGQIITVTAEEDAEWYYGQYTDDSGTKREGIFPKNFVEKYDPPAPPRPARPSRPKKEAETVVSPPEPAANISAPETKPLLESETERSYPAQELSNSVPSVLIAPKAVLDAPSLAPKPANAFDPSATGNDSADKPSTKPSAPAIGEKPASSSFKDRIAAFNKPAAPPIAPFKPGGYGSQNTSSSFIKKPFVAPPPSKNAYVPPPREAPPKFYRREEDPEIVERATREPPESEARPSATEEAPDAFDDQPKPTSLKERIALLQKQQLEQTARLAEAAQRKDKQKRPPKKRSESQDAFQATEAGDIERPQDVDVARDRSADIPKSPTVPTPHLTHPPTPGPELTSDTNDADYSAAADTEDAEETSTSKEDIEDRYSAELQASNSGWIVGEAAQGTQREKQYGDEDSGEDEDEREEEEEEEFDPEVKRRMELRERMAKMSGGMGMMGFFGPPGGMPGMSTAGTSTRKSRPSADTERRLQEEEKIAPLSAPPVPTMALPGMSGQKTSAQAAEFEMETEEPGDTPIAEQHRSKEVPDVEEIVHDEAPSQTSTERPPPPLTLRERPAPPLPPAETRPVPPVTPREHPQSSPPVPGSRSAAETPADPGNVSDDELSVGPKKLSLNTAPSVPAPSIPDQIDARRPDSMTLSSPILVSEKRMSRPPPPIPTNQPHMTPTKTRSAPPPPPGEARRRSAADTLSDSSPRQAGEGAEGEVTEYDGDYDTDIASGVKFKDALRSHARDSSIDEGTIADDVSLKSPRSPIESRPPPPPPPSVPRAVPPPPPSQPPKGNRMSMELPRGPPPPPPPIRQQSFNGSDDEYDSYLYTAPQLGLSMPPTPGGRPEIPPPVPPQRQVEEDEDEAMNEASQAQSRPSFALLPPPTQAPAAPPLPTPRSQRGSMDMLKPQQSARRSIDITRTSVDHGIIATDVDLAENSFWWTHSNTCPPVFQNRKDCLIEIDESSSRDRSGKTIISKDIYVLFMDYSQTVINVHFDPNEPSDASLEQGHKPPPHPPRQDQLEDAHAQFGTRISKAVNEIQNTTVGDGTPFGLVQHLLSPLNDALLPIGTRAYGVPVYSNLANASVQQNDEIRAGDIVSFRNARFQGHRGTMHQKYNVEVGKPDHVGIVVDWDGTKKKIRAWEQGRESKKVKMESFKLNDLRSGECRVWRVMPRSWIGWEKGK